MNEENTQIPSASLERLLLMLGKRALQDENTIAINYQAAAYGAFLEVVCNVAGGFTKLPEEIFMSSGNAHQRNHDMEYTTNKRFWAGHFYQYMRDSYKQRRKYVEIILQPSDKFLFEVGFDKRIHNIDHDTLDVDTFNKLKFHCINDAISRWLPEYGIDIFECPKPILMDYFRCRFKYPWSVLDIQNEILKDNHGFRFNYSDLFNKDKFMKSIEQLFDYAELPILNHKDLSLLYDDWYPRQVNYKKYLECQEVLTNTYNGINSNISLDCAQQGYIIATLEDKYGIEIRDITEETFANLPDKLKEYI